MRIAPTCFAAVLFLGICGRAQQPQNFDGVQIQVVPVHKNLYMLFGSGGNITVQTGDDGVLMVDTEYAPLAGKIMAEVHKLSTGPLRYIINTHMHGDHTGGNEAIAATVPNDPFQPLNIIAHANVLNRMTIPPTGGGAGATVGTHGLPVDEYETAFKDLHFNGEAVIIWHEAKAHTDGDSVILFRGSDVVSTGDIFTPERYPIIDMERGGTLQGEIAALNHILELTVPADHQEGGTMVIPGHGRLCDEADVVEYRDMVAIVRDRILDMIRKGMTLSQVKSGQTLPKTMTLQYGSNEKICRGGL